MASPKLKKSIFFLNRNFVRIHRVFISAEGGDEHYKRALGEMEISYERVDTLILISGIDEYIRPVIVGTYLAAFSRDAFERAAASSSHGKKHVRRFSSYRL